MKHVQIINRKTIRLLLLIFVLTFCMAPVSSYADGPWTDRADQSIYDSTGDAPDSSTPDMLDGGIFAELLGEFCIGIGDGLNFLLTSFGCDLNAIIFGRVGGASARTGDVALCIGARLGPGVPNLAAGAFCGCKRGPRLGGMRRRDLSDDSAAL